MIPIFQSARVLNVTKLYECARQVGASGEWQMTRTTVTFASALIAATALLAVACNSAPTVPVPPPEFCMASAPDETGMCTVGCDESSTARDVALVYNENWGSGLMEETNDDGSFELEIEADVGDLLIIQLKHDNTLSAEVAIEVPAPE